MYAPDKLTSAKIRKGNNSVITCDRITVLALCSSSDGRLSMYQSFIKFPSILSEICSGQAFYCKKIKKGSNSVTTDDRVMVLPLCNLPHAPLSVYQVSLNYTSMLLEIHVCSRQKCDRVLDRQSGNYMLSLRGA